MHEDTFASLVLKAPSCFCGPICVCKSGSEKIGAEELAQVEEMRVNPFAARICELFSDDGSDKLTFMMFLNVMSTFSKETHADVKMVWIFALWDFDGDDILGPGTFTIFWVFFNTLQ